MTLHPQRPPEDLRILLHDLQSAGRSDDLQPLLLFRERIRQMAHRQLPPDDRLRMAMDSEDLAQDALLKLVRRAHEFRGSTWSEFLAFVRSVLAREKTDRTRHYARQKRSADQVQARSDDAATSSDNRTPSGVLSTGEDRERLRTLISQLKEPLRTALDLRLEGLDYDRLAERMSISKDNARQRISRALRQLRAMWCRSDPRA